jgi:hypothetical protein
MPWAILRCWAGALPGRPAAAAAPASVFIIVRLVVIDLALYLFFENVRQ